jgi:hypothetical protein
MVTRPSTRTRANTPASTFDACLPPGRRWPGRRCPRSSHGGLNSQPEHEVAAILGLKFAVRASCPQVLIRWVGFHASGDTWEPLGNLTNCEEAIRDLERARDVVLPCIPSHRPRRCVAAALRHCYLTGTPWTRRPLTWALPWLADGSCTGGRRTAGSSVPLRGLASLGHSPSSTSWPTIAASWPRAGLSSRSSTPPRTGPAGSSCWLSPILALSLVLFYTPWVLVLVAAS